MHPNCAERRLDPHWPPVDITSRIVYSSVESSDMKVCPACGSASYSSAKECRLCGYVFPAPEQLPAATPAESPVTVRAVPKRRLSPLLISLLGVVGGGQVANHQIGKGVILFVLSIALLFAPSLVPSIVIYLLAAIDAHLVTVKRDRGDVVGDWDWC